MLPTQRIFFPLVLYGLLNGVTHDNGKGFILFYNTLEVINNSFIHSFIHLFSIDLLQDMEIVIL
jgi:hypothetical protein